MAGPWKAEVDFYSQELLLAKAAEVEGRWPLTHGAFHDVLPLEDPTGYFAGLAATARDRTAERFRLAIESILVGEMYEFIGKLRNIGTGAAPVAYLPPLAMEIAKYGAFLIGLHNRQYFTTGSRVLIEALALPHQPAGFENLARLVTEGRLADAAAVTAACERFWQGVVDWAATHGYQIRASAEIPF